MAACGSHSPVSGSGTEYGFIHAPEPVIMSPTTQVAPPATSGIGIFLSGTPLATTSPSTTSRSEGSISMSWPATSSSFVLAFVAATATALPPMNVPREAKVPVQRGEESVLETSIVTQS